MEFDTTLIKTLRLLEKYIYNLDPARKLNTLPKVQRELMLVIIDNIGLARSQIEFSASDEDQAAQRKGLRLVIEQLEAVRQGILDASMYDLVDVVDVAQLSAMCEICTERVKRFVG